MPWTPGLDGSGVVEAVGPGVTRIWVTDAVYGPLPGAQAEYAVALASDLHPKPAN